MTPIRKRIARYIFNEFSEYAAIGKFECLSAEKAALWYDKADDILERMRVPTAEMCEAGDDPDISDRAADMWPAMINAALEGK